MTRPSALQAPARISRSAVPAVPVSVIGVGTTPCEPFVPNASSRPVRCRSFSRAPRTAQVRTAANCRAARILVPHPGGPVLRALQCVLSRMSRGSVAVLHGLAPVAREGRWRLRPPCAPLALRPAAASVSCPSSTMASPTPGSLSSSTSHPKRKCQYFSRRKGRGVAVSRMVTRQWLGGY